MADWKALRGIVMNSENEFEEFCAMLSVVLDIARSSSQITIRSDRSSIEVRCLMFALRERLVQVTSTRMRSDATSLQTVSLALTPKGLSLQWGYNGELTLLECYEYGANSRNEIHSPAPALWIDVER
jgi:hypothetical protein